MHLIIGTDAFKDMIVSLRDLNAFVVVVGEGHVTRAAARLGMQQPHLSRMLRRMEASFATPLSEG